MRRGLGIAIASLALLVAAGTAPAASAATEFGNGCASNDGVPPGLTVVQTGREGIAAGLPGGGVITKWTINSGEKLTVGQKLKVLRKGAVAGQFTVVGESAEVPVSAGTNSFDVRIPVAAGDLLGLTSSDPQGGPKECTGSGPGEKVTYLSPQDAPVGAIAIAQGGEGPKVALPVRVRVEPDVDADGFGDETQDGCPTNASAQGVCPPPPTGGGGSEAPPSSSPSPPPAAQPHPLALAVGHKGSVTVKVTCDIAGSASVVARARLGGGASATLKGGPKPVAAGQSVAFTLKFPQALKSKLAELPAKQKLKLKIAATTTSSAGIVATKSLSVRLHGQA